MPILWIEHIDGIPLRKLGDEQSLSPAQTYARVAHELSRLPDNTALTGAFCDPTRFAGFLVLDGKYIKVRGFKRAIPFIYGIDYESHDLPRGQLSRVEDESEFVRYFQELKATGYQLKVAIGDDREGIKQALTKVYPYACFQLCHVHYLRNIRKLLQLKTDSQHQHFYNSLNLHVFVEPKTIDDVTRGLMYIQAHHTEGDSLRRAILLDIARRMEDLFTYLKTPGCPNNTNLIELYNSHLNGRLKTIKGFKSFKAASVWLNAYLIRRRTKPLTDCEGKFKHLNKHTSLELTIKKQALWPDILTKLGINKPKCYEKSD